MSKYKVTILHTDKEPTTHVVEGSDGPDFKDMYKLMGCSTIEITGARFNNKNYDLYIDEEGRLKDGNEFNPIATEHFVEWLSHEGRVTMIPNVVGVAAMVDPDPIKERQ
jgi:hypothetical protein|nr:hypothetical protein [uncultured Mediterranean phage uvMED]|tara:strand:+ start:165 stop:491 length:327 start_codon:yes stop_codon:yes gene_type:complete